MTRYASRTFPQDHFMPPSSIVSSLPSLRISGSPSVDTNQNINNMYAPFSHFLISPSFPPCFALLLDSLHCIFDPNTPTHPFTPSHSWYLSLTGLLTPFNEVFHLGIFGTTISYYWIFTSFKATDGQNGWIWLLRAYGLSFRLARFHSSLPPLNSLFFSSSVLRTRGNSSVHDDRASFCNSLSLYPHFPQIFFGDVHVST